MARIVLTVTGVVCVFQVLQPYVVMVDVSTVDVLRIQACENDIADLCAALARSQAKFSVEPGPNPFVQTVEGVCDAS